MVKPILFLDFDRTLFDTDRFYEWLGPDRFDRILKLTAGEITPPDFAAYCYADAAPFLRAVRATHRTVLLTYAVNTILQRKKIRGSGLLSLLDDVVITSGGKQGGTGKGEAIVDYLLRVGDSGWEHTFIDDDPANIDEVKHAAAHIRAVQIVRDPRQATVMNDMLIPPDLVIATLSEFINEP